MMTEKVTENVKAPDFELIDLHGEAVRLSEYQDKKHIVLVFNRGFL